MTTIEEATITETERAVAGLRELADFIEAHPRFVDALDSRFLLFCRDGDEFASAASELGGKREKGANDKYFGVSRFFGAIELQVYAERDQVCEAKVVGTETVEIPDPDAPKVTVTRDVIEWECKPILGAS